MNNLAIRAEALGKEYRLGQSHAGYRTLRESIMRAVEAPFRGLKGILASTQHVPNRDETIWALKDVSFEIRQGEVVGIIGRNGAGKSTLLKILSEITEPSVGSAEIHGRVGSLLEVGTGFHPELTGRENLYLNGAILGMKRGEIERKFDEIVAFAEVEKFIDTPVKHYSSGMYLRLAFAVAAHLEPEILIVDEVLAVGDAAFQKKCLGKMGDVAKNGRTVLFVSHNMPAVTRLCDRAIYLQDGRVVEDGKANHVVKSYLQSGLGTTAAREWLDPRKAPGGEVARLLAIQIRSENGECVDTIDIRQPVELVMEYEVFKPNYRMLPMFHLYNEDGVHVFSVVDKDPVWRGKTFSKGLFRSVAVIPGNFLSEGTMFFDAALTTLDPTIWQFYERQAVACQIVDHPDSATTARGEWAGPFGGVVRPLLKWKTESVNVGTSLSVSTVPSGA